MEQKSAAKEFAADWKGRGDEKQETQAFWLSFLQKVYGVAEPEKYIRFEVPVKLDHTSFIDGLISTTRILIEQKGRDIDLRKGYKKSDGSMLTPFHTIDHPLAPSDEGAVKTVGFDWGRESLPQNPKTCISR